MSACLCMMLPVLYVRVFMSRFLLVLGFMLVLVLRVFVHGIMDVVKARSVGDSVVLVCVCLFVCVHVCKA